MMINAAQIDWNDINKAVPAFLTISIMPLTYSISYGEALSEQFFSMPRCQQNHQYAGDCMCAHSAPYELGEVSLLHPNSVTLP